MGSTTEDLGVAQPDLSSLATTLCTPDARRCLSEHSPLSQICAPDGLSWLDDPCPDQSICKDQECTPFHCVPGRSICLGPSAQATCASSGKTVTDLKTCPSPLTCQSGFCVDRCELAQQDGDYQACSFIANNLDNIYTSTEDSKESPFAVIAANPHHLLPTTISMTNAQGVSVERISQRSITPPLNYTFGETTTVRSQILRTNQPNSSIDSSVTQITLQPGEAATLLVDSENKDAFFLESTQPVVAYQFNPYCCNFTASNDASLLLPTGALGTSYRVINYPTMYVPPNDLLTPYLTLIGSEDNTTITLNSPVPLRLANTTSTILYPPLIDHLLTINRGQIITLEIPPDIAHYNQNDADMSGAHVSSSSPIAAFVGHPCTFVPQDAWACDHLEEQLFPEDTLGSRYILPSIAQRNLNNIEDTSREGIYWRIVASQDATITTSTQLRDLTSYEASSFATPNCLEKQQGDSITLAQGEACEIGINQPLSLDSSAPLIIAGVISGHQSTGLADYGTQAGDPAMFLLPPVRQFRRDYSFITSPTFQKTYAVIIAPKSATLSYQDLNLSPDRVVSSHTITSQGQEWEILNISINSGLHSISSNRPFGLIVYAYDDYVSYAFPAGLDLSNNSKE